MSTAHAGIHATRGRGPGHPALARVGAALLLTATWRSPTFRGVAVWSGISFAGWLFGLVSAQWSGLADAQPEEGVVWPYLLLGGGIAVYLV